MAPAILNYFGYGGSAPVIEEKSSVRALPAPWYTSQEMYELERRAIYSKKWLLTTHKLRLAKPGDWLKYDIAGFEFILARDRDGNINGFHNVCRHRAYPVVSEDRGTSRIFSCRYHGWSYGLNGKLAKAPGYQDLTNFDKTNNGLLPIHVHIDRNGFIWVNLDGKKKPEVAWDDDFLNIDLQQRYEDFNFDDYEFDHTWEMKGGYNWKILADNYNECYHCATTHPDLPAVADLSSYSVDTKGGAIIHDPATTPEQEAAGLKICATYFFPNVSTNLSKHFLMIQKFIPHGPKHSTMRYEIYRNKNSTQEQFDQVNQIYKRVMSEDKALCDLAQRNLNAGVFINGEMHPEMEKGPLYFQKLVREAVESHHKREVAARQEIWPSRQVLPNTALVSKKDVEFCSGLACQTQPEGLVW